MKYKILMLVVAAMLMVGSALPALAQRPSEPPPDVCVWDWDRYLWRNYEYELWYYWCDYGDEDWYIVAFWNPDWGYWYE